MKKEPGTDGLEPQANQSREHALLERVLSLKQLLQEGRGSPVDRHDLAICYFHLENHQRTCEQIEQLIREAPDYIDIGRVYSLWILALVKQGHFREADRLIQGRLRIEDDDVILLNLHGYVCEKLSRPDEAVQAHRRVLSIRPDHPNSLNSLGYLLTVYGRPEDMPEAGRCLKRAVQLKPHSAPYLDSLGVFLARTGRYRRAKEALVRALQFAPENMEIIDHLKEVTVREKRSRS